MERAKRMTPRAFHVPAPPYGAGQTTVGEPPDTSMVLSWPSAKKPTNRLSGDQKGSDAPSVPESGCAESASCSRTHNNDRPSGSVAVKAKRRPSGETTGPSDGAQAADSGA